MEKNGQLLKYFWYQHFWPFALAVLLAALALPGLVGAANLELQESSLVLERFFSLPAVFLFLPLFLPDTERAVCRLIRTKATPYWQILSWRLSQILLLLLVSLSCFLWLLQSNHSVIRFGPFLLAELANLLFLGGLLSLAFVITKYAVIGVSVPIFYYVGNLMGGQKYFGSFYLFTLGKEDWLSKIILAVSGSLLLLASIYLANRPAAWNQ